MGDTELLRKARDNEGCSNAIKQALEWVSGDSGESDSSIAFVRENAESTLWWPAIVGDSYSEVVQSFGPGDNQEKAKFTKGWFNDKSSASCASGESQDAPKQNYAPLYRRGDGVNPHQGHIGDLELLRKARDIEGCRIAMDQVFAWAYSYETSGNIGGQVYE
jgi:hypothetical protein